MLLVETVPVGPIKANCSVVADLATHQALVIDPGGDAGRIGAVIADHGLAVRAIVLTHAHIDHVLGLREVKAAHGGELSLHEADRPLYEGLSGQASMFGLPEPAAPPIDRWLKDGDTVTISDALAVRVIATPGHSPGSICLAIRDEEHGRTLIFSGDTLFRRGIGRCDLWGGDSQAIARSIRERLYTCEAETQVIPGHGPATTIGEECARNPFVRATPR